MGAHLNAYTSREQTVFYAKCFKKDLARGKLLYKSEIVFFIIFDFNVLQYLQFETEHYIGKSNHSPSKGWSPNFFSIIQLI